MILQEFKDWLNSISPELAEVSELLSKEMSDEPMRLVHSLTEIEIWLGRFNALLAQCNSFLDRYSLEMMPPKEGKTEREREVLLHSMVSPIKIIRDTVEGYSDAIKTRLSVGQSLLKYHIMFIEKNQKLDKIY